MRFELALRHNVSGRTEAFREGLKRCGHVEGKGDLFVTWNRFGLNAIRADEVEFHGGTVLVAENALWGNGFLGKSWLSISRGFHGTWQPWGGPERWDSLGVELPPMRATGETVILGQRGIGNPKFKMPSGWAQDALRRYGGRIRNHPGREELVPLEEDLANCGRVITWSSGAAIKALLMGIPVISEMPGWIGEQSNTELSRLEMLRRLAWSHWTLEEISQGVPFHR